MKNILALILCLALPAASIAGDEAKAGYNVKYDGGSLPNVKSGSGLRLYIDATTVKLMQDKTEVATIPATSITEVSYGQDVHRRVGTAVAVGAVTFGLGALTALSKSKKHYVGLTWANGDQKGGLVMQCDKNEYRGILAALEGVSGKKAVNSDTMTVKNQQMRTIAFFTKTLPCKIADEVRAAGYNVLRPLEIAEVMYQCEHQGVDVVIIAPDVEEDERVAVQLRCPTITLKANATTTELLFELSNVFPEGRVRVN